MPLAVGLNKIIIAAEKRGELYINLRVLIGHYLSLLCHIFIFISSFSATFSFSSDWTFRPNPEKRSDLLKQERILSDKHTNKVTNGLFRINSDQTGMKTWIKTHRELHKSRSCRHDQHQAGMLHITVIRPQRRETP